MFKLRDGVKCTLSMSYQTVSFLTPINLSFPDWVGVNFKRRGEYAISMYYQSAVFLP